LLNPNATLSGASLLSAAQGLANAQTKGPITELQQQIAANNAQTKGTINQTGGFYNQLMPAVQQGVTDSGNIASGLNSTLSGIGSSTQSQLQGIGQGALSSLMKYAPQGDGGLANAATSDLAASIARQQGLAAQQAGTYQGFGAVQGANNQQMAASQLGTYGLQGQEALKAIAQSGTVKNEPLVSKIAAEQAQTGALTATDLGKLRQQEIANQIAEGGLGIKATTAATGAQNANTNSKNANTKVYSAQTVAQNDQATQTNRAAAIAQSNLNNLRSTNTSAANNAANNSTRILVSQMARAAKTGKVATGAQANAVFSHIDYVTGEIENLINHGLPPTQAYHIIQNGGRIQTGTSASGTATYRTYFPNRLGTQVLNAAFNARSGGSGLTSGDLAFLAALGIKNPTRYARAKPATNYSAPQYNSAAPTSAANAQIPGG
jgi:hypothetical protein